MSLYNKKSNRLNGLNPLAYLGAQDADASAQVVWANRAPTTSDYDNWYLGALWIDESIAAPGDPEVWMLVKKDAQVATWIRFGGGFGDVIALRAQDGLIAYPTSGIIDVSGSSILNTTAAVANTISVNITNGTAGQVIIGGGSAPAWGNITSTSGTVTITNGANTINLEVGPTVATTYTTDAGNAIPALNVLNILGSSVLNTAGTGNTVTVGLTNGTAGQVIIGGGAAPAWGTITSTGGTVTITLGANTINMEVGPTVATTYTTDSGSATPAANVLNVSGGDNINTAASGNTVTVHLNETIHWPDTNAAGTSGMIYLGGGSGVGGNRFLHNYGLFNTFLGENAGNLSLVINPANTGGNVGIGVNTLRLAQSIWETVCIGALSGESITNANFNTAVGSQTIYLLTTGAGNTAVGINALRNLVTGDYNCAVGCGDGATVGAGVAYTSNESNNVCIQNSGVVGENNTIRIGAHGAGAYQQNRCFIAGIRGITTGVADAIAVLIDSAHQLGTVSSSRKYKDNIKDMGDESSIVMDLRPVTFNFKAHPDVPAWGLIAEEVADIFPQLVVFDPDTDEPETVKYHELPVLLLNELQKQQRTINKQADTIKNMKDRLRILEEQVCMLIQEIGND